MPILFDPNVTIGRRPAELAAWCPFGRHFLNNDEIQNFKRTGRPVCKYHYTLVTKSF